MGVDNSHGTTTIRGGAVMDGLAIATMKTTTVAATTAGIVTIVGTEMVATGAPTTTINDSERGRCESLKELSSYELY